MTGSALILAGPTAAGKTAAALDIAERWQAVVVSADAMQVYRGMDIGTGKATAEEQARAPHIGLDLRDPDEPFDASDFMELADQALVDHPRIVVAGGTALYIRAFVRGLVLTPPVDPALRTELATEPELHARLKAVDPDLAARLHPNDRVRIVRGLEVFLTTGERLSALHAAHAKAPDRITAEGVWLDRSDLYDRIDRRVELMVDRGYVGEVEALLRAGYDRSHKPLQSLGYRHMCDHVLDELDLDEAVRRTQRDTRHFARKQRNWAKVLAYPQVLDDHEAETWAAAERAFGPLPD